MEAFTMSKSMKKLGLAVLVAMLAAAVSISFVLADPLDPDDAPRDGDGTFFGPRMGRRPRGGMWGGDFGSMGGREGSGMREGADGGGWMADYHDEMHAAVAEALELSVEVLDAAMADGQMMWQIAEEQGIDPETIRDAMQAVREDIINQAVADGALTQEQADWMLERAMPDHAEDAGEGFFRPGPRGRGMGCR
jgi:hypothetical protein